MFHLRKKIKIPVFEALLFLTVDSFRSSFKNTGHAKVILSQCFPKRRPSHRPCSDANSQAAEGKRRGHPEFETWD